jgi:P-type Mg2+ transporter
VKENQEFWHYTSQFLFEQLKSGIDGLTEAEAKERLFANKSPIIKKSFILHETIVFLKQYSNPLILLLIFAAALSGILKEYSDSLIIVTVLLMMGIFSYLQERFANRSVQRLQQRVQNKCTVLRHGVASDIYMGDVVQGDIILLNAGDIIPADGLLLDVNDLHINESILTGESFPAEKSTVSVPAGAGITQAFNSAFKGTSVVNGTAKMLVVHPTPLTEFDKIENKLSSFDRTNSFEKGIIRFGNMILKLTLVICAAILIVNLLLDKPVMSSVLFSLAIAVGLAPELLPAILTVTMAAGARKMASKNVIVKKLDAIQNLGQMDVLCCDKTGTITEGAVKLAYYVDYQNNTYEDVKLYAYLNANYETGFNNPVDEALRSLKIEIPSTEKIDEIPYDFIRKRLSVVVKMNNKCTLITKGAFKNIIKICDKALIGPTKDDVEIADLKSTIDSTYEYYNSDGYRCIAICIKDVTGQPKVSKSDESGMAFLGLLVFTDPLKTGVEKSVELMKDAGISIKLISGDNVTAVKHVAKKIGLNADETLCGEELSRLNFDELRKAVNKYDIFAETDPAQKEFIIKALQLNGHTVGFLGDGINDAQAIKLADVGISVDDAADVARDAATVVLLNKDLNVLLDGVMEGRKTFVNIQKYIFLTTSANFGNMFSMALFSVVLPFLPLLPTQILLNNFLSDIPTLALARDRVDGSLIRTPPKWNILNIKRFMFVYGIQSSIFDILTFLVLLYAFNTTPEEFRSAWFLESLLTEVAIIYVIRTKKSVFKSRPSALLLILSIAILAIAVSLTYIPDLTILGMVPLPSSLLMTIFVITVMYGITSELLKRKFLQL